MRIAKIFLLAGILLFCTMPISLAFPKEIQVTSTYQTQEYKPVEHSTQLLDEYWNLFNSHFGFEAEAGDTMGVEVIWTGLRSDYNPIHIQIYDFSNTYYNKWIEWGDWDEDRWTAPRSEYYTVYISQWNGGGELIIKKYFSTLEWVNVTKTKIEKQPNPYITPYIIISSILGTVFTSIGLMLPHIRTRHSDLPIKLQSMKANSLYG